MKRVKDTHTTVVQIIPPMHGGITCAAKVRVTYEDGSTETLPEFRARDGEEACQKAEDAIRHLKAKNGTC